MPGALERKAAADLVRRVRQGSAELLGALGGEAVMVVDLDSDGDLVSLEDFASLPVVVVGIGGPSAGSGAAPGVDVALTETAGSPAPWVDVPDLDVALGHLAGVAAQSPRAAAVLVQVLRRSGRGDLGPDLIAESLAYSTLQAGPEFAAWLVERGSRPTRPADAGPAVVAERTGARLDITLNRPHVRNAYSSHMRDQLCEALALACADQSVAEVHLRGAGPDFCSGGDLDEFGTLEDPASAHLVRTARSAARLLDTVADRAVAHLHGACIGAGIELPALAARVMASSDARMQLPELSMGLIPGAGGTASLPRRIGRHRTAWLALSGEAIDAPRALEWGLVDEIVG